MTAAEFMRFTAPDPQVLAQRIEAKRLALKAALDTGEALPVVDAAADLAGLLTTARLEAEAVQLLEAHLSFAQGQAQYEPAGWFWCAYATALQYGGRREQAEPHFARAVDLAATSGWRRLEALALHHWGRSLVEQGRVDEAQARIAQALAIREELGEPSQENSRRALEALRARHA